MMLWIASGNRRWILALFNNDWPKRCCRSHIRTRLAEKETDRKRPVRVENETESGNYFLPAAAGTFAYFF